MKRGLIERLVSREYSTIERTGLFCAGLALSFRILAVWDGTRHQIWLETATYMLFAAPSFLVGGLLGRLRAVRGSWRGALLAVIAGALFSVGAEFILHAIRMGTLAFGQIPGWLFIIGYPLGIGLAASFPRLDRRADLDRLRDAIVEFDLPRELSRLVRQVARMTRLWMREQADVARDLAESFSGGLASGATPSDLIAGLGGLGHTARRIRRERLRQRPLAWRIWHRSVQIALWVMAIAASWYAYLFVPFNLADSTSVVYPSIFTAEHAGAIDERAWPHYRAGLELLAEAGIDEHWGDILELRPVYLGWSEVAAFLAENREAFDQLREGASKPRLGFDASDPRTVLDMERSRERREFAFLSPKLLNVAQLLLADFRRAVDSEDAAAAAADFEALLFHSRQCRQLPAGLSLSLTIAVDHMCYSDLGWALLEKPTLFPDDRLARWVRMIEPERATSVELTGRLRAALAERHDWLYGKEGEPGEELSPAAIRNLLTSEWRSVGKEDGAETWLEDWGWTGELGFRLEGPLVSAVVLGRRAMAERGEELLDEVERYLETPRWRSEPSPLGIFHREVDASRWRKARLLPLVGFCRVFGWVVDQAPLRAQRRDVTLVAIALARFYAVNGDWPEDLAELVPAFLPEVPLDVFDGEPLRYRRSPSGPTVYSVGPNRTDEAIVVLFHPWNNLDVLDGRGPPPERLPGDWLLLPPTYTEAP